MKYWVILFSTVFLLVAAQGQSSSLRGGFVPKDGFVPDSATAVAIAEAVLVPVYGKETVESERPFKATFQSGVWTVVGTLHCPSSEGRETVTCDGGNAEVKLSKADGRIVRMIHYK